MGNAPALRPTAPLVPAGAAPDSLSFGEMLRRAEVLARTELVPKPLQGNPEAIVTIGVWGAEHGVPLMTAIQEVHVIENRPSPSAQLRLALIRRAGHEVRWVESTAERAVVRGRRREYRHDPDGWVTVEYTADQARQAGLLAEWVERWESIKGTDNKTRNRKTTIILGPGRTIPAGAPAWVAEEIAAGKVLSKDNWQKYPADMLRARAASVLARMEFSDVMAALGIDDYTAEERGYDIGQDLDEPATTDPADEPHDEVEEAELVDEPVDGPQPQPPATAEAPDPDGPPVPAETADAPEAAARPPAAPVPRPGRGESQEQADLRYRLWAYVPDDDKPDVRAWLERCGIDPDVKQTLSAGKIAAVDAELDRRGYRRVRDPQPDAE